MKNLILILTICLLVVGFTNARERDVLLDMGPVPPGYVKVRDLIKSLEVEYNWDEEVVLPVPGYIWRHGCVLTSTGMLFGYWDGKPGFEDLFEGDCSYQSFEIDQIMASGGIINPYVDPWDVIPFPPGQEQHMEDYSLPIDTGFDLFTDAYITAGREPHPHNSFGDYMKTSWSSLGITYGGTRVSYIGSGMDELTQLQTNYDIDWGISNVAEGNLYEKSAAEASEYEGNSSVTPEDMDYHWNLYKSEIDAGRPVLVVVDTVGYGSSDHLITGIGYREDYDTGRREYASLDTWPDPNEVRWEEFAELRKHWPDLTPWGIYTFYTVDISPRQEFVVTFPDPAFEALIREALNKPTGDITNLEMRVITVLNGNSRGIYDLTGIEHCRNLEELSLNFNSVSDISLLSNLIYLKILNMGWNNIVDISPIESLFNLEIIFFKNNSIEEMPDGLFFHMLISLEDLDLSYNQISGLTSDTFGRLLYLEKLKLNNNQILAIPENVFSEIRYIENINLSHNQINYVHPKTFLGLRYINYLYMNHNQLEDVSFIFPSYPFEFMDPPCWENMQDLWYLYLNDNLITDISGLLGFEYDYVIKIECKPTKLKSLRLQNNLLNLESHCKYLPQVVENNPDLNDLRHDDNPNPFMQDCSNNILDLSIFQSYWLDNDCINQGDCEGLDFDFSGNIDLKDYAVFADYWLQ